MLRMIKLIDCTLLSDFRRVHPLNRYSCAPVSGETRVRTLEWHAYISDDYLRLRLEGGASRSDSEGIGPAITGCEWCTGQGERALTLRFTPEAVRDIEPGHHVETTISVTNRGRRVESGVFQMALPPGIQIASPATNRERAFLWQAKPGETIDQPVVLHVERAFDASLLYELNYGSVPVSVEVYWESRRMLLNVSLPFATPPPAR